MSFLGGPECSTAANPLAQFQKQTSQDTSLQRDRLQSRPQQLNNFRSQQQGGAPQDAAFQEFQAQRASLPFGGEHIQPVPDVALWQNRTAHGRLGGGGGTAWANDFTQQGPAPAHFAPEEFAASMKSGGFAPQDFAAFRQQQQAGRTESPLQQPSFQSHSPQPMYSGGSMYSSGFGMQRPMGGMGMGMGMSQQQQNFGGQQEMQGKGKGKVQELSDTDWERQFAELSTADQEEALDAQANRDIEEELNGIDRLETGFGDFENVWQGIQAEKDTHRQMTGEDDQAAFAQHFGDEYDQWKDFDGMGHDFDGLKTYTDLRPELGNYLFEENNLFHDVPNAFEEGIKIMREGGNLSLAALAFESAVRKQPDHVDAWVALGQAQAQNEKESPAIRALEQALKLDPDNLDALMGLSVSYTNEGYDSLAYRTLERWVSVKYPQLNVTPRGLDDAEEEMGFTDRHQLHEKVTDLFLSAARLNPDGAEVDVDVQVGLGVLFYGSEEYDQAVDCFTAALNSHHHGSLKREGEEHLLWNRLGATLANSGRSEEAIEAYTHALELRSNFVRARYNLGVSCINLGVQEQAAAHLLGALSMHRVIESEGRQKAAELMKDGQGNDIPVSDAQVEALLQQNQSTNLYETLKRVFLQMGRRDLADSVGPDMNLDKLRGEFEF